MKNESGQILILVFIALGIVLFTVLFIIGGAQVYYQNANYSVEAEKALALAEAGIDKAVNSLNKTNGSYSGETETFFGEGSFSVTVSEKNATTKILHAEGYLPNKTSPKVKRAVTIQASKGIGIAFNYGMQIDTGGLQMGNGANFTGSIYSNGNVTGGEKSIINGDIWVAGGAMSSADQQSDCSESNCQDYLFGTIVEGQDRQDIAQSFKTAKDGLLSKISLKLKKVGFPINPTIRIMADSAGAPDKNNVLATGLLSAASVTNEYSFTDITFNTNPNLQAGHTYWIMFHSQSLDSNNYWIWSNDFARTYNNGYPLWSDNWQATSPTWTSIIGDLGFKTFLSGSTTSVDFSNNSVIRGDVHANTISGNMTITKDAYFKTIAPSVVVSGVKHSNSSDPDPAILPISLQNISQWKKQAEAAGVSSGDVTSCIASIGPGKIVGNVSVGGSCNIKVFSPVWITGNLLLGNNSKFTLDSSFAELSGVMVVDGQITLGNGNDFLGSGTLGSYLMLLSTYDSETTGNDAFNAGNSSISGIIYAPLGQITLPNGASFKELVAWKIVLGNNAILNYQSDLATTFFASGPDGEYSLVKGTYQTK